MEPEQKNNIIKVIIILSAILIAGLILAFPARQFYQKAQETNQQIKIKEQEKSALEQRLVDLKQLEINYKEAKEKSKSITLALPTDKDWPDMLAGLETIASSNNIRFVEIKSEVQGVVGTQNSTNYKSGTTADKSQAVSSIYQELPISISIEGNFGNLKTYLKGIEKNIRILDINSINIEGHTDSATSEKYLVITLKMNGYFQPKK